MLITNKIIGLISEAKKIKKDIYNGVETAGADLETWKTKCRVILPLDDKYKNVAKDFSKDFTIALQSRGSIRRSANENMLNTIISLEEVLALNENTSNMGNESNKGHNLGKNKKDVFVVYGRNTKINNAMFTFLRALGTNPIEWEVAKANTKSTSSTINTIVLENLKSAQAVVVLLTPDDEVRLRLELTDKDDKEYKWGYQARPNVFYEAGVAMAINPTKTIFVEFAGTKPFSDISGIHKIMFDGSPNMRNSLRNELITAGVEVSEIGNQWLDAGDFSLPTNEKKTEVVEHNNDSVKLSDEGKKLLIGASLVKGQINKVTTLAGIMIKAGNHIVNIELSDGRAKAKYEQVFEDLLGKKYIKLTSLPRANVNIYELTEAGYTYCDNELKKREKDLLDILEHTTEAK